MSINVGGYKVHPSPNKVGPKQNQSLSRSNGPDFMKRLEDAFADAKKNLKEVNPGIYIPNRPITTLADLQISGQFIETSPV